MPVTSDQGNDADNSQQDQDPVILLGECCEKEAECRFHLVRSGHSFRATFLFMRPDHVELRLTTDDCHEWFDRNALCCVSFSYRTSFCAFLGSVIDGQRPDSSERRVAVTIPAQLTITNARQSFRVPVLPNSGLESTARLPGDSWRPVRIRDLSATGAAIEFPTEPPELLVGARLKVELRFRGGSVQMIGEIRRHTDSTCAVAFASPDGDLEQQRATQLHGMVLSLQQIWLKSRLD
jgi:hypothetical protein